MDYAALKTEYEEAGFGWQRAAFGSIIRRHYNEIIEMSVGQRKQLITAIGAPDVYMTELLKELKVIQYDTMKGHIKDNKNS